MAERVVGTIKFYNRSKGYGFCTRDNGSDVFVHSNALKRSGIYDAPNEGERLEFDLIEVNGKGPKAENIKRVSGQ